MWDVVENQPGSTAGWLNESVLLGQRVAGLGEHHKGVKVPAQVNQLDTWSQSGSGGRKESKHTHAVI